MSEVEALRHPSASSMMENFSPKALGPASPQIRRAGLEEISSKSLRPLRRPGDPLTCPWQHRIVYRKELTEALRDRTYLISTLIVPLVLFSHPDCRSRRRHRLSRWQGFRRSPQSHASRCQDSPAIVAGLKKLDKIEIVPKRLTGKTDHQ